LNANASDMNWGRSTRAVWSGEQGRGPEGVTVMPVYHGATLDPMSAFLLTRGLKTLALRVERQNRSAPPVWARWALKTLPT
jgi:cystathionine beta-lyase/cystathionine gamma-synthase